MSDNCCPSCKGPLGICRNRTCFHHIEVQASEDRDDRSLRLYTDHTARDAVRNVMAGRRR